MNQRWIYCIDTSSLIDLKRLYPQDVFPGLWDKMGNLGKSGRLIAPNEVFNELRRRDDELFRWAKSNKGQIFKSLESLQLDIVKEIVFNFPKLIDPDKETRDADPYVIALAISTNEGLRRQPSLFGEPVKCVVVAEEKKEAGKIKIPDICEHYGMEWINLIELFRREEWKF